MCRSFALALLAVLLLAAPAGAADPRRGEQWNLDLIQSDAAHPVSTGAGAVVAVVDSGTQADHPDLAGHLRQGYDFVQNDASPQDGNGHGTHVSGIISAVSGNGIGVESVAPGARVLPVRVLGDDGGGSTDTVAKGVDYARTHGADVINLSLGSDIPLVGAMGGDAFDAAVHRALAAGIVVVAASGNNGVPVCEQPAAGDGLLCVGAVDKRKRRSFFSSFGSGLGLLAPGGSGTGVTGEDVLSTYKGSGYEALAGTSQAAPHVSGVAALLVARGVRGQAAVKRILGTATDLGAPGVDPVYGAGLLNARAAVAGLGGGGAGGGSGGRCHPSPRVRAREEAAAGADRPAARDPGAGARSARRARAGAGAREVSRPPDRARLESRARGSRGDGRRPAHEARPPDDPQAVLRARARPSPGREARPHPQDPHPPRQHECHLDGACAIEVTFVGS